MARRRLMPSFVVRRYGPDLFSSMPEDASQKIIGCLPLKDAVRMSSASTYWRYKWAKLPHVILDKEFYDANVKGRAEASTISMRYSNIIDNVLLCHEGNICKFVLYIPRRHRADTDIHQWLQSVSPKTLKYLSLIYNPSYGNDETLKLPSKTFFYQGLTTLTLHCFTIPMLPSTSTGFPNLLSLELRGCSWDSNQIIDSFIGSCPELQILQLIAIEDYFDRVLEVVNLSIDAPKLEHLVLEGYLTNMCLGEKTTNIRTLKLDISGTTNASLAHSLSVLQTLQLGPGFFPCAWLYNEHGLTDTIGLLETHSLELIDLPLYFPCVNYFTLKLLKSSLFLQRLKCHIREFEADEDRDWPTLDDVGYSSYESRNFPSLKYAEFVNVSDSVYQSEFIRTILERSPVLEVMIIKFCEDLDDEADGKLKIIENLSKHSEASENLVMIFEDGD